MSITLQRDGQRIYIAGDTYAAKDRIKAIGGHWDGDRRAWWVSTGKLAEAEQIASEPAPAPAASPIPTKNDLYDCRVYSKVEYKGRSYYCIGRTADGQRLRLATLDDLEFWADATACRVVKEYPARDMGRYGRTKMVYTTIGSLRRFVERQADPARARGKCTECGEWGPTGQLCRECSEGFFK